ncbi:hypothetical protein NIES593_06645 [Hydrococcus rivularis NIES-593]|uniref:Uncharacterized protein n=1 Tax=Hydrococcus rivularis NIES-593 TaxID=1921803 RepID=A0A1U7HMW4_9CYAN|nr:hypothetical protein NIES593_06645 [Hydrococcus rivularis NIES-593]
MIVILFLDGVYILAKIGEVFIHLIRSRLQSVFDRNNCWRGDPQIFVPSGAVDNSQLKRKNLGNVERLLNMTSKYFGKRRA